MKKLLLIILLILNVYLISAQEMYELSYELNYNHTNDNTHCTDFFVEVFFQNNSRQPLTFGNTSWRRDRNGRLRGSVELAVEDKIERVEVFAERYTGSNCRSRQHQPHRRIITSLRGQYNATQFYDRNFEEVIRIGSFTRTISGALGNAIFNEELRVSVRPIINLRFNDGVSESATNIACESESIRLGASNVAGFEPRNDIYRWQYFDRINGENIINPNYQSAIDEFLFPMRDLTPCFNNYELSPYGNFSNLDLQRAIDRAELEFEQFEDRPRREQTPEESVRLQDNLWRAYGDYLEYFNTITDGLGFFRFLDENGEESFDCDLFFAERPTYELGVLQDYSDSDKIEFEPRGWRTISSKTGQTDIELFLRDMFPEGSSERLQAINRPLSVRTISSEGNASTNRLTVQYLPEPPSITTNPEIRQPTCNYTNDAGFTMTFDRDLEEGEVMDIVVDKLAQGQTPLTNGSTPLYLRSGDARRADINRRYAINVANDPQIAVDSPNYDPSNRTYEWTRPIEAGHYVMRVAGFIPNPSRENNNLVSVCREFFYFFEITAPEQVSFSATATNQRCFGTNDGTIQITASGGSGVYEYILNGSNWNSAQTFTAAQSPLTLRNQPPGTYNVQVRDNNGCLDRENATDQPKVQRLTIAAKSPIAHNIIQNTNNPRPVGAPGLSDGEVTIATLSGGTPREDIQGQYFNYQVLLNGTTPSAITGKAYLNTGVLITGLPAGNHDIRYTDANSCTQTLDLPTINAPEPIRYTLTQRPPSCADATDGELRITNLQGGYPNYNITWRRNGTILPNTTQVLTGGVGTYSLRITDTRSGVAVQENITFANVPPPLTFTEQVSPIQCFGGLATVTITARGGVPPYEYGVTEGSTTNWYTTNTIELPASFVGYRFQVRQVNNATCVAAASNSYRISEPEEFYIDAISVTDNTIFQDNQGAIRIVIIGDTAPYTVTWQKQNDATFSAEGTNITGLTTGYYIPTVTDNTGVCTIQGNPIFVDEPDELLVAIDAVSDRILCHGNTGGLIANTTGGSENYSYRWFRNGILLPDETAVRIQNYNEGSYRVEVNDGFTTANASAVLVEPSVLELTPLTGTNISCYNGTDGTIRLQPTGGTAPYAFSINNKQTYTPVSTLNNATIEGLTQGTYNVWLRDSNGCEITVPQTLTLTQPTEIVIAEVALQDVTTLGGNDGSIEIAITGGTGAYTITWEKDNDSSFQASSLELTNLTFGSYTVSVSDANSCIEERTFTVRQPLPMVVQITQQADVLCHADATAQLLATVTGGYPIESTPADFQYQWFSLSGVTATPLNTDFSLDQLSRLPAGTYRIDVNDVKGATASTTFQITQPDDLQALLEAEPVNVLCYGEATGQIAITVTGGPRDPDTGVYLPYTYAWEKQDDASFTASEEDLSNLTAGRYTVTVTDANLCTVRIEAIQILQPEAPLAVAEQDVQNLTGFQTANGSIAVQISGGTTPYTYSWTKAEDANFFADTPQLSGLSIGNYMLNVTDAHNCTLHFEQVLTEPEQLLTQIPPLSLAESVQCFGGTTQTPLQTQTTGGVVPYTYQWTREDTPGQVLYTTANTPLVVAGDYTLQVTDANGNQATAAYTVAQPDQLQLNANVTHLLCHNDTDGRIDISVTGGVLPYTYLWSNGETTEDLSELRAGNYSVRIQDANGCILEDTISVNQPRALAVGVDRVFPSALGLRDGNITLNVFGGTPPYNYQWRDSSGTVVAITQNILNDTGIEKYAATITDANNCTVVIDDVDLFEPPALEVFIDQISVVTCFGNTDTGQLTAVVEGGIPFNAEKQYNYAWYNADTNTPVGADANTIILGAGNYYVDVTDVLGTTQRSAAFTLEQPDLLEVTLTADFINCGDANDWTIETIVTGGTAPYQYTWQTSETTALLQNVVSGSYTVNIVDQRGCTATASITTVPPPALTARLVPTNPICYNSCDGGVQLEPQGGTPPYRYAWSTGATTKNIANACAGTYTVSITDAKGCNIIQNTRLENPEQRIIDLGADVTLCKDQTLVLDASINEAGAAYLWTSTNGFTASTPQVEVSETGDYTVTVTDAKGCVAADTLFVQATTKTIITDFIGSSQVFVDERVLLFDISDPLPDGLQWEFSEGTTIHHQDNDFAELSFKAPGIYTVSMRATFGLCEDIRTKTILVVERTFIAADGEGGTATASGVNASIDVKTYPNPAPSGVFTVEIDLPSTQDVSVKIYGIGSNIPIATKRGTAADYYKFDYNLQRMPSGLYFILLETTSGDQVHKLVIE